MLIGSATAAQRPATVSFEFSAAFMYAFMPALTSRLQALGSESAPPLLELTCLAAQIRTALTHSRLHQHLRRIDAVLESDDAVMLWHRPPWEEGAGISVLRRALDYANALPPVGAGVRHVAALCVHIRVGTS